MDQITLASRGCSWFYERCSRPELCYAVGSGPRNPINRTAAVEASLSDVILVKYMVSHILRSIYIYIICIRALRVLCRRGLEAGEGSGGP